MEDDNMNNEYIGDDEEDDTNLNSISHEWGTWDELLLACAVKRHGFSNWNSVATEVQSRTSLSAVIVSANNCMLKYRDLKRRFQETARESDVTTAAATAAEAAEEEEGGEEEERVGNIPWLEELRSLRVAELRREVQRYDVSILSLQLKVKKLEEEREERVVGDQKPDLEDERKVERLGNDGSESEHREKVVSTAAEVSDQENRSMNESNSTTSGGKTAGDDERVGGDGPSQTRDDPDPKAEEGSVRGSEASHSGEFGESGTSERKWKSKRRKYSGGSKNDQGGAGEIRSPTSKSQPLIGLIDIIRSHPRGTLFERRLRSQETQDYKSMVKQHLDIETIHRNLKQGSYDSSRDNFYRDLQLLFTNAIVFFPLSSSESMAAQELRTVVSEEMRKETGKSSPRLVINREVLAMDSNKADAETSDSSLSRQKSLTSLVVCKKRSFVSAKTSPSSSSFSHKEETKEETLSEEKENIVIGVRSSRRSNKVIAVVTNSSKTGKGKNKQKQTESKANSLNENNSKQEKSKTEKKTVSSDKKKSVADFLKRLKKNSPQKEGKDQNSKKESKTKPRELRSKNVSKKKAEVENTPVKRAPGRPQKKMAEAGATANASALGKRGRESGSTGKDNKQAKKRSRR